MRCECGQCFAEGLGDVLPVFAQRICITARRNERGEVGRVMVECFFKGAKGVDDATGEWVGIRGLTNIVEGLIPAPFADDQPLIAFGCDDARHGDAMGEQVVCNPSFYREQVVGLSARERCKKVVFNREYRSVGGDFPNRMGARFGNGFDFLNPLSIGQVVAEQAVDGFGHDRVDCAKKINRGRRISCYALYFAEIRWHAQG